MKNKKKILTISSSSKTGGGPSHIFLISEILKDDFEFFLAMPKIDREKYDISFDRYLQICERKFSIKDIYNLVVFAKKNKIDIIHAHGKGASLIGRIIKIIITKPLIYTFHGIHTECLSIVGKLLYKLYENLTGWIDNEKIFVSESEKLQAIDLKIFFTRNYSIINNATEKMERKKKRLINNIEFGIKNRKKNIISICRLVDQKNIFEIFDIARILPMYNFLILGDGYLYNKAKNYLNKIGIKNVYLLGNKKDIFKYLYSAEIFLSTSLYEGHPISILEAISIGLPIVASNVTGNCDTIKHGHSGFYYNLGNTKEAANFILKIIENNNLKEQLSFNAFNTHRKLFTVEKLRNSLKSVYQKY